MGRDWRLGEWRVEVICGQLVTSGHAFGMANPIGFFCCWFVTNIRSCLFFPLGF